MSDQTADDLAAGREWIEKHGWTKYELETGTGKVCSVGGLMRGMGLIPGREFPAHEPRIIRAALALGQLIPENVHRRSNPISTVTDWNDDHVEDEQTILDAFAKAEKIERAGFDPDEQ